MTTFFRKRRSKRLSAEKSHKIIIFRLLQLRKLWFAIPLHQVIKVIIGDELSSEHQQSPIMLTEYQGQKILVLDVDQYIFQRKSHHPATIKNKHLLLFKNDSSEDIIALPIDSPPQILDVKSSEFKQLPQKLNEIGNITLLSDKIVQRQNHPLYVVLSPAKMILPN